ncbi:MAG: YaiO family outer membrane beta-barrel protein [Tsuneonella sp.]
MAQEPDPYEAGVAARLDGRPAEAKRLLEFWLSEHPEDVDAQLQLAYAELALGQLDAAEAGFEAVLLAAPDYADARSGLDRVRARRVQAGESGRVQIAIEGAFSDLSGSPNGWTEVAFDVEAPFAETTLGGRISHYRRFGLDDVEFTGRLGFHPSENLWLRLHLGTTPNADFRPEFEIGGGADLRLAGNPATVLTFDTAYQKFPLQDVFSINPGVVQYFEEGRTWLTLRGIGTVAGNTALQVGALVRFDHAPKDRWRLFAGAATGPDTDLGVITRVKALFGGIEAPLGTGISAGTSLSREWREVGGDRTELRVTVKARL